MRIVLVTLGLLVMFACDSVITVPTRALPLSTPLASVDDQFLTQPIGNANGSPCCIYHDPASPVGVTLVRDIAASGQDLYGHTTFQVIAGWRHDSLLRTVFTSWGYARFVEPRSFGWQSSSNGFTNNDETVHKSRYDGRSNPSASYVPDRR
jgi:hypothetical protein